MCADWPAAARQRVLKLRTLVYEAAATSTDVGPVTEALRWGQLSYLTLASKSGTTVRLDYRPDTDEVVFFVHCQTTLVSTYRALYPTEFDYEGDRAVVIRKGRLPISALRHCFALALTYHSDRRRSRSAG